LVDLRSVYPVEYASLTLASSPTPLFERLGGEEAVQAAVVLFYDKAMADPEISPFFVGYELKDQVDRHIAFMTKAFGGPIDATWNLPKAHQKLVQRGLGDKHIDGFIRLMREVLADLGVSDQDTAEVVTHLEAARAPVLGRP